MASIKELKLKINSLKSTGKITKAMKMIAAVKLRKAQKAVTAIKPYTRNLQGLLNKTLSAVSVENALITPRDKVKKIHLLVFTSDRGLCGAFNNGILKEVDKFVQEQKQKGCEVVLSYAGKRGYDFFEKKLPSDRFYSEAIKLGSYEEAEKISRDLLTHFETQESDEVYLLYNYFKSAISQIPQIEKLFPVETKTTPDDEPKSYLDLFEPNVEAILNEVVIQTVRFSVYEALLNSIASEHASRMTAMDNASKNAGELIDKYTLQMNRARQAAITTELAEIVSGAESLKG